MHCYICNKETNNLRKDPDGKLTSICSECREAINECNRLYKDVDEDDLLCEYASMSPLDILKRIDKGEEDVFPNKIRTRKSI